MGHKFQTSSTPLLLLFAVHSSHAPMNREANWKQIRTCLSFWIRQLIDSTLPSSCNLLFNRMNSISKRPNKNEFSFIFCSSFFLLLFDDCFFISVSAKSKSVKHLMRTNTWIAVWLHTIEHRSKWFRQTQKICLQPSECGRWTKREKITSNDQSDGTYVWNALNFSWKKTHRKKKLTKNTSHKNSFFFAAKACEIAARLTKKMCDEKRVDA